jgi:hypothetical protein
LMNAHDRRQLETMRIQLEAYEVGRIDLSALISSLESLMGVLETIPTIWRQAFRKHWGMLEEIYSTAVVQEEPIETPANASLIAPSLREMRGMIDAALEPRDDVQ